MSKLIKALQEVPTEANRQRLAKYIRRHPMAIVMATPEEIAFLRQAKLLP